MTQSLGHCGCGGRQGWTGGYGDVVPLQVAQPGEALHPNYRNSQLPQVSVHVFPQPCC